LLGPKIYITEKKEQGFIFESRQEFTSILIEKEGMGPKPVEMQLTIVQERSRGKESKRKSASGKNDKDDLLSP